MNIKQAKQEIINTVQAYLTKDETGEYAIPVERQRPVLLIGPPGIGKTAIMEQVAQESAGSIWFLIRSHTIRDRVRSDCRLSRRKPMMGRMYRSQSIQ